MNVGWMPMPDEAGSEYSHGHSITNRSIKLTIISTFLLISTMMMSRSMAYPLSRGSVQHRRGYETSLTRRTTLLQASSSDSQEPKQQGAKELGFLSFDLDDTLFHTGKVVRAANEVMLATLHDFGCTDVTLPEYLETTRAVRKTLDAPITYRGLRELAIRTTFETSKNFQVSSSNLDELVQTCYLAWETERHAAAERYLFEDCIETLESLRNKYPDTCIAAITNGAGNPLEMTNSIARFFDFRVSGEENAVFPHRKPDAFIYQYSYDKYKQLCGADNIHDKAWLHVGDCLANDVSASADCGAKAIWMCLGEDDDSAAARLIDTKKIPEWSTAPKEEIEERARKIEEGKSKVSAKISNLSELPAAISKVLELDNS